ncbi:U32 family peptidase [Rhodovulum sulfidophilum]|nr:U32 family peptidase [Rhodovulum sulfidophilum DSM 1374]ANB39465.1 U32 family peptidase [Rhodovulum sulfidophilum]MBK5922768.1 U32 family peptidase [Rhodovulum sulfidophilum]MBL3550917.1 U32 family peptidase [Rhodovulum sulfidophilum]MBL3562005.1 U32 family peptidase [Rhodovulum sulfidophilum]
MEVSPMAAELTLGPNLFHWPAEMKLDFYNRIADESPVSTVYLGEVICSKRTPFFDDHHMDKVAERLERAGKKVVFSSFSEVVIKRERNLLRQWAEQEGRDLEVNNTAALLYLKNKPHRIGALLNVYNEDTMAYLHEQGANHFALLPELPRKAVAELGKKAGELGVGVEVQVFGRASLALSARCYHARAHARTKDNCQFVCGEDCDGMILNTMDEKPFLVVNGIQTLSYGYLDLLPDIADMKALGVTHFRVMPHSCDMIAVTRLFDDVLAERIGVEEGEAKLRELGIEAPFVNGFYHGKAGHDWTARAAAELA